MVREMRMTKWKLKNKNFFRTHKTLTSKRARKRASVWEKKTQKRTKICRRFIFGCLCAAHKLAKVMKKKLNASSEYISSWELLFCRLLWHAVHKRLVFCFTFPFLKKRFWFFFRCLTRFAVFTVVMRA